MNIIQITPGAGRMYCGNCFRDNTLVAELRRLGHEVLMVPLYLPLTLDEPDQTAGTPVFFGGVNVYFDQQSGWFRRYAPNWLRHGLSSPGVLRWAARHAAKTRAAEVGELAISMLRGEEGNQARDLEELTSWLKGQPRPDAVCLSNALLIGMARRLRQALGSRITCMLQGEDGFLDALPPTFRERAWQTLADRARDVDLFIAPSRYFADLMTRRLNLPADKVRVVHNGITVDGYPMPSASSELRAPSSGASSPRSALPSPGAPAVGYFARMCVDKGLDLLVDAFIRMHQRGRVRNARLRVGGGCGPADEPLVEALKGRLQRAGLADRAEFLRNPDRAAKIRLLRSMTVFSVPARCGEAFGLYVLEALAAGVPVVLPRTAAFPELVENTGGGLLCKPDDAESLATALEELLCDEDRAYALGRAGQAAVHREYTARRMAENMLAVFRDRDKVSWLSGHEHEAGSVRC